MALARREKITPLTLAKRWGMEYGAGRKVNIYVLWNVTRGRSGRLGINDKPAVYTFYWDGFNLLTRQQWNKQHHAERICPPLPKGDIQVYIDAKWTDPPSVWELSDRQYFDFWSLDGDIVIRRGVHDRRRSKPLAKYTMPVSLI